MRLVGVVSSKDGGGADSAHIEMVKWDDTSGSGAGEMRRGAFMMTMVSAPTVPARARIGAVAAVVSWILAVALEAVWVGRKTFLSFAQQ